MSTPVTHLREGEKRFPKRRNKTVLDPEERTKFIRTVYLVIRTMRSSDGSIVEQPISAHPTSMDAIIRQQKEESDNTLGDGIKFNVVGLPVTKEVLIPSPTKVERPVPSIQVKGMGLTLVENNLEGDEEEEDDGVD